MITLSKLRREHAAKVATSATATATDADDACACACDAMGRGLKSQQTLEQHLKQYHKGKMPTGDCSWLKQYKKNHPDFAKKVDGARQQLKNGVITQSEHDGKVAEIAKAESDVDTLDKKQKILKKVKTSKEAKRNAAIESDIKDAVKNDADIGADCKVQFDGGSITVSYRPTKEDWQKMRNNDKFWGSGLLANALDPVALKHRLHCTGTHDEKGVSTIYFDMPKPEANTDADSAKGGEDSKEAKIQKLIALHDDYNKWFDESDKTDKEAWLAEDHKRTEALKAAMEGLEVGKDIQWDADKKNWYALGDESDDGLKGQTLHNDELNRDETVLADVSKDGYRMVVLQSDKDYSHNVNDKGRNFRMIVSRESDGRFAVRDAKNGSAAESERKKDFSDNPEDFIKKWDLFEFDDNANEHIDASKLYKYGDGNTKGVNSAFIAGGAANANGKGSSSANEPTNDNLDYAEQPVPKDTKVKDWYAKAYPSDTEMLADMTDASFEDVLNALNGRKDVYDVIGAQDSIVRERVFQALTNSLGCEYGDIYDLWLSEDKGDGLEVKPTWTVASSSEPKYDTDKHGGPMIPSARRKEIRELQKKSRELVAQANGIEAEGRKNKTGWMDAEQYGRYQEILDQNYRLTQEIDKKKYDYYKEAVEAWKADKEAAGE